MWEFLLEPFTWAVAAWSLCLVAAFYFFPAALRSNGKVPTWALLVFFGVGTAGLVAIGALFPR